MKKIPIELKNAISENNLMLFVGSGLSTSMGFPNWKNLLLGALEEIIIFKDNISLQNKYNYYKNNFDKLKEKDIIVSLLNILDPYKLETKRYISGLLNDRNKNIQDQKIRDDKLIIHKKLWGLSNNIITTNYDQILETANSRCKIILNNNEYLLNNFNRESFNLFKIHGTIDYPNSCILFEQEYNDLYSEDNNNLSLFTLKTIIKDYVILFMGFSMDDPYIEIVLRKMKSLCGSSSRPNYIISKSIIEGSKELNLTSLLIEDYDEIDEYLNELLKIRPQKSVGSAIKHYDNQLYGREDEIEIIQEFIHSDESHFFLLYGLGGIGKSHLLFKVVELNSNLNPIIIYGSNSTNFNIIASECNIKINHLTDSIQRKNVFINEIISRNLFLIIDDFYNIYDEEFLDILPDLVRLPKGKIIIVSWSIPDKIKSLSLSYKQMHLDLIKKEFYFSLIDEIIKRQSNIKLNIEIKEKIFQKTLGHPLGTQFVSAILLLPGSIDDKLGSLPQFDPLIDLEGKSFSQRLLGVILNTANEEEETLLSEFSAFNEPVNKNLITLLPAYQKNPLAYISLINKDLIYQIENDKIKLHALVREFMYSRLKNKNEIHQLIGSFYGLISEKGDFADISLISIANYHLLKIGGPLLDEFYQKVRESFRKKRKIDVLHYDIKNTIKRLEILLEKEPNIKLFKMELGIAYRKDGNNDKALFYLEQFKNEGNNISANEMGIIYKNLKKYNEAINSIILYADQGDTYSMNILGIIYKELGDYEKAIYYLSKNVVKGHIQSITELGMVYRLKGDFIKSVECLKQPAIEENQFCLNELGITYREMGDLENAIYYFEKAIAIDHLSSFTELAITYRMLKDYEKSILYLKQAISKGSEYAITELAITYFESGNLAAAKATLEDSIGIHPNNIYLITKLVEYYRYSNEIPKAIEILEVFLKSDSHNLIVISLLVNLYKILNNYGEREKILFNYFKFDSHNLFINIQISSIFNRYRKYRVSLKILELIENKNLKVNLYIMEHYYRFGDQISYKEYNERALKIIEARDSVGYEKLKERLNKELDSKKILVGHFSKIGTLRIISNEKKVEYGKNLYPIYDEKNMNNRLKDGDKVFYALYLINNFKYADYVEQYFDKIDDLAKLN